MKKAYFLGVLLTTILMGCNKESLVLISTNYGDMKVKLYDETPLHKANFLKLASEGVYDSLLFHRVINQFMIQGGDPTSKNAKPNQMLGQGGPGYTISAEFNDAFIHKKGALAAARQGDAVNPKKESSGSQFYIVQGKKYQPQELKTLASRTGKIYTQEQIEAYKTEGGTPFLDGSYTVFGEVVEGLDVVEKIASVKCDARDRPVENVIMQKVKIVKK